MIVKDILNDLRKIVGNCDKETLYGMLTDAITALADEGRFDLLTSRVDICTGIDGKTVTLPRFVETPLSVNVNGSTTYFRNKWYEFHVNGSGSFAETSFTFDDQGWYPCFMDIIQPSYLTAVCDLKTDINTKIRIYGYDHDGKWIRTQEPDGTWKDGFEISMNMLTDFPYGIPVADDQRLSVRNFETKPITELDSTGDHNLSTGAAVTLGTIAAPLPTPYINGGTYYVRKIDDDTVSIHSDQSGAQTNSGVVEATSVGATSVISLTDRRTASVLTKFESATPTSVRTGLPVTLSATTMPAPFEASTDYFARVIDDNSFTLHATVEEAGDNLNPIDATTAGTAVYASTRQYIAPITELNFAVNHNLIQGDSILVKNDAGELPSPLIDGTNYFVKVIDSKTITLHNNISDATTGASPIVFTSSGTGPSRILKTITASTNPGTASNITAVGHNLEIQTSYTAIVSVSRARASDVATIITNGPHLLTSGDRVKITGFTNAVAGDYNDDNAEVTVVNTTTFTYKNIGTNEATQADTGGDITRIAILGDYVQFTTNGVFPVPILQNTTYRAEPPMSADTFTLTDAIGNPINILNSGSGQLFMVVSRVFTIDFTGTWETETEKIVNGTPVNFASTGTLPPTSPVLNTSSTYYARVLTDDSIEVYETLAKSTDTAVRTSATRARASNVATVTTSAAHGLLSGDHVDIANVSSVVDGVLVTCTITVGGSGYTENSIATITNGGGSTATGRITVSGGAITHISIINGGSGFTVGEALTVSGGSGETITVGSIADSVQIADSTYNGRRVEVTFVDATTFTYTSVGLDEPTTVDANGQITIAPILVLGVGVGDVSLVFKRAVDLKPFTSSLRLASSAFLTEGSVIRMETTGTLPAPLAAATDYLLAIVDGLLEIRTMLNVPITLTDIGSGIHSMVITANFTPVVPTSVEVVSNEYIDGDAISVGSTGVLPSPLVAGTYYARRIDDDSVEFYNTYANAIAAPAVVGRVVPMDTGSGTHTLTQTVANIQVKQITRISKDASNGFVTLWAHDNGRTDAMTVIGNYFPDETEPMYRRIKIGESCAWVRLLYQKTVFKIISDDDFIPLRSKQAILMMAKALKFFQSDFSDKGEEWYKLAVRFARNNQRNVNGASVIAFQFNQDIMGNPCDDIY